MTFAQRLFKAFDENGDLSLEFNEFVRAFSILSPNARIEDKIIRKK